MLDVETMPAQSILLTPLAVQAWEHETPCAEGDRIRWRELTVAMGDWFYLPTDQAGRTSDYVITPANAEEWALLPGPIVPNVIPAGGIRFTATTLADFLDQAAEHLGTIIAFNLGVTPPALPGEKIPGWPAHRPVVSLWAEQTATPGEVHR
ncbi:hypothetical protein HQQ81_21050 [Microbacteriaceae bacterium VKM Ac-2854]|nr:hypothetical protein [Microbacteriaceae bacterium VKM Ac-2854]